MHKMQMIKLIILLPLKALKHFNITNQVETNQIFVELPIPLKDELLKNTYYMLLLKILQKIPVL